MLFWPTNAVIHFNWNKAREQKRFHSLGQQMLQWQVRKLSSPWKVVCTVQQVAMRWQQILGAGSFLVIHIISGSNNKSISKPFTGGGSHHCSFFRPSYCSVHTGNVARAQMCKDSTKYKEYKVILWYFKCTETNLSTVRVKERKCIPRTLPACLWAIIV